MPTGGHENCPHAANRSAHLGFGGVGRAGCARLVHRGDSFPGEGLGEPDRVARGLTDVRVVEETVDGRGREGFGHELVKARRVEVSRTPRWTVSRRRRRRAGRAPQPRPHPLRAGPISSTTIRSARRMRATTRLTESSERWARTRAPRSSRRNHATRIPASTTCWPRASRKNVFPVPDGPQTTTFSFRPIHSKVRNACWVGAGIEDAASSQVSNVFPSGSRRLSDGW